MSFKDTYPDEHAPWRGPLEHVKAKLVGFVGVVRWGCFWTAIATPFLWTSLLVQGIGTGGEFLAFSVLITVNVLALVVGHGHEPCTKHRHRN